MTRLFSSVRLVPGVRLSTSRRGLRAHIGPRMARVHVGGGGTGLSTGAGPFTAYQSMNSGRRDAGAASGTTGRDRHLAAANILAEIESMHRRDFASVERGVAPSPRLPKFRLLLATAEKQELGSVGRFDRGARREALVRARHLAETWASDLLELSRGEVAGHQSLLDHEWQCLVENDPELVRRKVNDAFAHSGLRARAVHQDGGVLGVVVGVPGLDEMPELKPTVTSGGADSVGRLNKTERAGLHAQYVAAQVILAAKQSIAAAPGLVAVRVVAAPFGVDVAAAGAFVAATIATAALAQADMRAPSWELMLRIDPQALFKVKGRIRELDQIKLSRNEDYSFVVTA